MLSRIWFSRSEHSPDSGLRLLLESLANQHNSFTHKENDSRGGGDTVPVARLTDAVRLLYCLNQQLRVGSLGRASKGRARLSTLCDYVDGAGVKYSGLYEPGWDGSHPRLRHRKFPCPMPPPLFPRDFNQSKLDSRHFLLQITIDGLIFYSQ